MSVNLKSVEVVGTNNRTSLIVHTINHLPIVHILDFLPVLKQILALIWADILQFGGKFA